jgi:hypothetical protein
MVGEPMEEDEYRAVIEELVRQLRQVGVDGEAEESNYVVTNPETGESELLAPQERLIAMLQAFERFLAVRDGKVARRALGRIGATLGQSATGSPAEVRTPNGASVVLATDRELVRAEINLLDAPDLTEIRGDLDTLIRQLKASGDGSSSPPRAAP